MNKLSVYGDLQYRNIKYEAGISAAIALIIGSIMAPLLGGIDQAFQFIQEYTGIVSPGILAVFTVNSDDGK